jgi:hypothetical protein
MVRPSHWRHPAAATLAVTALAVATAAPASATVVFVPTPAPVPDAWRAEVPVSVEWADVSLRIPDEWTVKIKRAPAVEVSGASLLVAFGPDDSMCMVEYYVSDKVDSWQDVGVSPSAELSIDGHPTERFDDMLGPGGASASAYSVDAGELVYSLYCTAEQAPADRWLSIAETLVVP